MNNDNVLRKCFELAGVKQWLYLAGTCKNWQRIQKEINSEHLTEMKAAVESLSRLKFSTNYVGELVPGGQYGRAIGQWASVEVCTWWLEHTACPLFVGMYAMEEAAKCGRIDLLQLLTDKGVDSGAGIVALRAAKGNCTNVLEWLDSKGMSWRHQSWIVACEATKGGALQILQYLDNHNLVHFSKGSGALVYEAMEKKHKHIVTWLYSKEISPSWSVKDLMSTEF